MSQVSYLEVLEQEGHANVSSGVIQGEQIAQLLSQRRLAGRGVRVYAIGAGGGTVPRLLGLVPNALRLWVHEVRQRPHVPTSAEFVLHSLTGGGYTRWASLDRTQRLNVIDSAHAPDVRIFEAWARSGTDGVLVEVGAEEDAIDRMIADLAPGPVPATPAPPADTDASASLRAELLDEGWPDSAEVARRLGSRAGNTAQYAAGLRSRGKLLGVKVPGEGVVRHPRCQFGADGLLLPVMADLLAILPKGDGSGWSQAFWLYSPHPALDGAKPADLLTSAPDRVLDVARDQFEEDPRARW